MSEQDSPWKEALERYFPPFLALYFPAVHAAVDWTRRYEWLNTELRQAVHDAELGKRLADVLVKVWRMDGQESWLLIHVEVQGWAEPDFAQRLFVYHYRIKVLEASDNPFALVTRAHLATMQTRHDPASRHQGKIRLIRELYERGMSRNDVLQLFRIIDWMMDLPEVLEQLFRREAEQIEQEKHMPYVTSVERLAIKQERIQSRIELLVRVLERRLKTTVAEELVARIRGTSDLAVLEGWFDLACEVSSLEEFKQRMQS